MKTVRRLRCNEDLDHVFRKGKIFVEYGTMPGFFYSEEEINPYGVGSSEGFLKKVKILNFFEEIEPIPFKETAWFAIAKEEFEEELENAKLVLEIAEKKHKELVKLGRIFK